MYVFARMLEATTLVVAINVAEEPRTVQAPLDGLAPRNSPPDVLFSEGSAAELLGSTPQLALAPRSGIVIDVSAVVV